MKAIIVYRNYKTGHFAIQRHLLGQIHLRHRAFAEQADELVTLNLAGPLLFKLALDALDLINGNKVILDQQVGE